MDKELKKIINDAFEFDLEMEYEFHESCGFTFVFRRDITMINKKIASAEIQPVCIIYEENDEYYCAPLHGKDKISDIVKEFVEKKLLR